VIWVHCPFLVELAARRCRVGEGALAEESWNELAVRAGAVGFVILDYESIFERSHEYDQRP
jgi:hypothetical protein